MSDLVPAAIGADEARERLARVKVNISAAAEDMTALYRGRAWITLGFDSWDDLCDHELGGVRIALPRDQRREVVGQMREGGMSTRAIGTALGIHHSTVAGDIGSTVGNSTVDTITGLDGRQRPAHVTTTTRTTEATKVEHDVDLSTGEILDAAPAIPVEFAAPERSYMTRFFDALVKANAPLGFDAERVGREASESEWPSIVALRRYADFVDRAERARRGLRVVNGGK